MTKTILVVDDEQEIVDFLKDILLLEGYMVLTALNGTNAIQSLSPDINLIILDVMLPDMDGFDVCREIRKSLSCPILFLSADDTEKSKIQGLMIGGDDYIHKPFSVSELKARIIANLRRVKDFGNIGKDKLLTFENIKINLNTYEVFIKDQPVRFTKTEFDLLKTFALHPQQILTKEQLFDQVWGYNSESDLLTVVEHVKKIRTKLALLDSEYKYIETSWGIGYKWSISKC
ncbi:response regulator [Bacillus lacus]|uniref:Response regulator n=1 Tax=Metabacillus lacus TaxID=1983721 RepID=A0A7X2J0H8_9BACI|nr:response regulator transcription factor [Metabacillus lacus]MRX72867.1 response regulator [Metabacillus lacus]